jgi:hypothetical protein
VVAQLLPGPFLVEETTADVHRWAAGPGCDPDAERARSTRREDWLHPDPALVRKGKRSILHDRTIGVRRPDHKPSTHQPVMNLFITQIRLRRALIASLFALSAVSLSAN